MPIDLSKLKSARVIEDLDEAFTLISKANQEREAAAEGRKGLTLISRAADGSIQIRKATDKALTSDGAPVLPAKDELKALAERRGLKWDDQYPSRMKSWWASDERVDAHGDIVKQNWHFDEFSKNSPMPFNHGWGGLSVGKHLDWRVIERRSPDYQGAALWLMGVFATPEVDPEADRIFRHVDAGLLPAGSVGFYSKKVIDVKDEEERKKLGLGRWGYVLDENHLLEFSPTMIGANPGALTTYQNAKARGLLRPDDMQHLRELQRRSIVRGAGDVEAWKTVDGQFRALSKLLFPALALQPHEELDTPINDEEAAARKAAAYTPPAVKDAAAKSVEEKLAELSKQVSDLTTAYNETMTSLSGQVSELRDLLEECMAGGAMGASRGEQGGKQKGAQPKEGDEEAKGEDRRVVRLVLNRLTNKKA